MMMKMIKKIAPVLALMAVLAIPSERAEAQENFFGASWMTGLPSGDMADYTESFSWRGMSLDYRRLQTRNVSWGFSGSWQVFNDKVYTTETGSIQLGEEAVEIPGALSGTQFRYINVFPFMATAQYTFGMRNRTRPYLGIGAGGLYSERRTEIGTIALQSTNWHFAAAPEVGLLIPLGLEAEMYVRAMYNWTSEAGGLDYTYFTFSVGVAAISF